MTAAQPSRKDACKTVEAMRHREFTGLVMGSFSDAAVDQAFGLSSVQQPLPDLEADRLSLRHECLRFFLSDQSRHLWQDAAIERPESGASQVGIHNGPGDRKRPVLDDREGAVMKLWLELRQKETQMEEQGLSVAYHEQFLFDWFLLRYDLDSARSVFWPKLKGGLAWIVRNCQYLMLALVLGAVYLMPRGPNPWRYLAIWVLVPILAIVLLQWGLFRKRAGRFAVWAAAFSLVPRLAGTVMVGLFFILSNGPLSTYVVKTPSNTWAVAVAGAGSFLYFAFEISRRVRPVPRPGVLFKRALDVLATGAAYSLALSAIGQTLILKASGLPDKTIGSPGQVFLLAAMILAIGVVINVIWAEEPVTKPL